MPKVDESHKEARKEQILSAALTCFAEQGFHKTTMADICKKSNLSAGAVYSYFKSKDEIIETIAKMGQQQSDDRFMNAANTGKDYIERFKIALGSFIDAQHDPFVRTCNRMDSMIMAESFSNEKLFTLFKTSYDSILDNIRKIVAEGQKHNLIDPKLDVEALTQILLGVVQSLTIQLNIHPEIDIDTYKKTVTEVLLNGMTINGNGKTDERKINQEVL